MSALMGADSGLKRVELMSFTRYLDLKNIPFKLSDSWKKKLDVEDKCFVRCNILFKSDL